MAHGVSGSRVDPSGGNDGPSSLARRGSSALTTPQLRRQYAAAMVLRLVLAEDSFLMRDGINAS